MVIMGTGSGHTSTIVDVRKFDNNEKLQLDQQSCSFIRITAFSTPSRERNQDNITLNRPSWKQPKWRKYWPKIVADGKTPETRTPKLRAAKRPKTSTPFGDAGFEGKTSVSKSGLSFSSPSQDDDERNYVQKNSLKASVRRALDFNPALQNHLKVYQRRRFRSNQGVSDSLPLAEKGVALKVYQRRFRPKQCVSTSRRLGPIFPRMWKKRRMSRQRAANLSSFIASEDGVGRQNIPMYDALRYIISTQCSWKKIEKRSISPYVAKLEGGQLTVQNQNAHGANCEHTAVVPYIPKKQKVLPKVYIDQETERVRNLLMASEGEDVGEGDKIKEKFWEKEREVFRSRVESFNDCMKQIQGDRRFSPWKGSVVDSVVGVFLTQNVSDKHSSSAFMSLAAKYPLKCTTQKACNEDWEVAFRQESVGCGKSCGTEYIVQKKATPRAAVPGDLLENKAPKGLRECNSKSHVNRGKGRTSSKPQTGKNKKSKGEKMQDKKVDWDVLREAYSKGRAIEPTSHTADSLDWEAVRQATVDEVADAIKERGQQHRLAKRIKDFLNRVLRTHETINLEWLRYVLPAEAKDFLLSIYGLGLKSAECVRLLTLRHKAFPVDTNVGRVAVRLGWVPLEPLPESLLIHLLERYPLFNDIQKYLWPRLCTLDAETLYELHYQMITFGKVFCTKRNPNCLECPMRRECKHFASKFASAIPALPGPEEEILECSVVPDATIHNSIDITKICEPIIEFPTSPKAYCTENLLRDIEDLGNNSDDDIDFVRLNTESVHNPVEEGEMSNALVPLLKEAASIPVRKLKDASRLNTVHEVYELPDGHPILEGLNKREPDDPCPYLFAIWLPEETANFSKPPKKLGDSQGLELCHGGVCGTILIPCRTATRGSFPLNGTYFQVNEVFADDESSHLPLQVPRIWLWNLPRRSAYFGKSASAIVSGFSIGKIRACFRKGYVCVRGFNRETREPMDLAERFHRSPSSSSRGKTRGTQPPAGLAERFHNSSMEKNRETQVPAGLAGRFH